MKKRSFICCLCLILSLQFNAQTNTFPTSGDVGIGTTNPAAKLEVKGGDLLLRAISNDVGDIVFQTSNSTQLARLWSNGVDNESGMYLSSGDNTPDITISSSGDVGIGITNPSAKLQVEGRTSVGKWGVLNLDWTHEANWGGSSNKWSGYIGFNAHRSNNDIKDNYFGINQYTSKGIIEGSNYGFRWLFRKVVNNDSQSQHQLSEYMRLDNNGNLGIGTASPDTKLTVKGNIHTNEVKVDLMGAVAPDYVFHKDYDLKPLKIVEDYIKFNGHLPNIPSAKDMETDGILLKEMNLKLLEKIEELTLYVINQEKKLEKVEPLEKELQSQKVINQNLENRLQKIESLLNSKK